MIFSLLPRVAEEIRALYAGASFPAAVAVDEKEECIEVEAMLAYKIPKEVTERIIRQMQDAGALVEVRPGLLKVIG